jgi:hypothetical protein
LYFYGKKTYIFREMQVSGPWHMYLLQQFVIYSMDTQKSNACHCRLVLIRQTHIRVQTISVTVKSFLRGTDWILKYYLYYPRSKRVNVCILYLTCLSRGTRHKQRQRKTKKWRCHSSGNVSTLFTTTCKTQKYVGHLQLVICYKPRDIYPSQERIQETVLCHRHIFKAS